MQYNTQREKLLMPEYGRAVQDMVNHAVSLEDRAQRQACAEAIVAVMANMQPQMREQPDFIHRLWDHLAYISNYQLDIDYPCEITHLSQETTKPTPLKYPTKKIRQRQYGRTLESYLEELSKMPQGEERDALLTLVANQMKQSLYIWNRDAMDDEKVAMDIARYTEGRVNLDTDKFEFGSVGRSNLQNEVTTGKKKKKR